MAAARTTAGAAATAQDGGPPFQVNTFTTNNQNAPAIGADAAGAFVVSWQSQTQDGSDYGDHRAGVRGQRRAAHG